MRASILCVAGTRPEAIKVAPVVLALRRHDSLAPILVATGQHRELLAQTFAAFGIAPDIDLDLMRDGQAPVDLLAAALPPLAGIFANLQPAAVLVQGDTMTALAAAQAAALTRTPLVHIEAGLRTGVRAAPFPEELNRRLIAQLADLHFAPTSGARDALLLEGVAADTIAVTGNTGIDALRFVEARFAAEPGLRAAVLAALPRLDPGRPLVLVTAHRRENHGAPLASIAEAVARLAADGVELVLPLHPHPAVCGPLRARLAAVAGVHLVPPLGYAAFVALLSRAAAVLTDSGGVQEEAPALGVPVLVTRDVTERGEGLVSGNARLVGTTTDRIVASVHAVLAAAPGYARMAEPALPYGDGEAAPRIVAALARAYASAPARAELVH